MMINEESPGVRYGCCGEQPPVSLVREWEGKEKEWVFALLTLGVYAWSVQEWKRYSSNGFGLVFLTIFMLLNINPIFYLLLPPIISVFFSLLLGCILIPFYQNHREAVGTSWCAVLFNMIMQVESNDMVLFWFAFFTSGIGAVLGFRRQSILLKRFYTFCFLVNTGGMLIITLISQGH
jgi:hypothetical protein